MTWVKLDDGFPTHPKVVGLSDRGFRAYVTGLCYCAQHLTDGQLPAGLGVMLGAPVVDELVSAGLWDPNDAGWTVRDYLDYNPPRSKVVAEREAKRVAGAKGAAKRWASPSDASRHGSSMPPSPSPSPKKLEKQERGKPRARNVLVDTLAEIEGSNPHELTRPQARALGVAVAEIRDVTPAVSPDDLKARAAVYRSKHPDWELTGPALAKHWAQCSPNGRGRTAAEREL